MNHPFVSVSASAPGHTAGRCHAGAPASTLFARKSTSASRHRRLKVAVAAGILALLTACGGGGDGAFDEPQRFEGVLSSGGRYVIDVPAQWNGGLYVYSVGYIGSPLPASRSPRNASDDVSKEWLLSKGYALAGSQPVGIGWAVGEIMPDQAEIVRTVFPEKVRVYPRRTIAWGDSMGGLISAGLMQQYPELFHGAVPLCGSVAGGVGMLNQSLDAAFTFKTLLAPGDAALKLTGFANAAEETAATTRARQVLTAAQATPAGRARIALAAAFAQLSNWSTASDPEPARTDWAAQQVQHQKAFMFAVFSPRFPLESRAGGNFSWNNGIDYRTQLARSGRTEQVTALYQAAGLDLEADLNTLAAAPRITADAGPVDYMRRNIEPTGALQGPVLTLHESGDNAPTVTHARAYSDAVATKGNQALLRQSFVHRPGHCAYTPAEKIAALQAVEARLDTGAWGDTSASGLNTLAARVQTGTTINLGVAGFADVQPDPFLRR